MHGAFFLRRVSVFWRKNKTSKEEKKQKHRAALLHPFHAWTGGSSPAVGPSHEHFKRDQEERERLLAIVLQLMIIFMIDSSVDYYLDWLVHCLVEKWQKHCPWWCKGLVFFVKNPKIFIYNKAKQVLSTFVRLKYNFLTFLRKSCFNDELIIKIVLSIRTVADVFNNYFVLSKKLRNVWLVGPRNTFSSTSFITHRKSSSRCLC